jgi:ATP-binding cassette subfamily F protein 3
VLVVSHDRALLDAVPDRIVVVGDRRLRSYAGGWADLQEAVSAESAPAEPEEIRVPRKSTPRPRPEQTQPSELELLEERIARAEAEVALRERKLAEDWGDEDAQAGHRAARDELTALLERWEVLFTEADAR